MNLDDTLREAADELVAAAPGPAASATTVLHRRRVRRGVTVAALAVLAVAATLVTLIVGGGKRPVRVTSAPAPIDRTGDGTDRTVPLPTSPPTTTTVRSGPECGFPLNVDDWQPIDLFDPTTSASVPFGAFTDCEEMPVLAFGPVPVGWHGATLTERLQLRYDALTENRLGGYPWPHPGSATVRIVGSTAIIDLPADFLDGVVIAPGSSGVTFPLWWTAFLEPGIDRVRLELGGSVGALAARFEADPGDATATTMTRDRYESTVQRFPDFTGPA